MNNHDEIVNQLKAAGLNDSQIFGIMANLKAESGFDNTVHQDHTGGGLWDEGGYGLAQWTTESRKAALQTFADSRGEDVSDLQTQVAFLLNEIDPNLLTAMGNESKEDAAKDFMRLYESPADQSDNAVLSRIADYKAYLNDPSASKISNESGVKNGKSNSISDTIQKYIVRILKLIAGGILFLAGIWIMISNSPKTVINENADDRKDDK